MNDFEPHPGSAGQLEFSADGNTIGPVQSGGTWGTLAVRRPPEFSSFDLDEPDVRLNDVMFSADDRIVAAGHVDMVTLSESDTGTRLRIREAWRMSACAFKSDGQAILVGVDAGLLHYILSHPSAGKLSFASREIIPLGVGWQAFGFSPNGNIFATYNVRSNATFVFDQTLTNRVATPGAPRDAGSVSVSPDGR